MCKSNHSSCGKGQCHQRCWLLGLFILGLACLCMTVVLCLRYCRQNVSKDTLTAKVVENIRAGLDVPSSFQLIRAEQPDSAFGVYCFSSEEQAAIGESAMEYSFSMLEHVSDLYDDSLEVNGDALAMVKVYGPILQKAGITMSDFKEKGSFSGWKVKTVYSFCDASNHQFTLTRWTFFDPKGEKILGKLELPGDVPSKPSEEMYEP